MSTETAERPDVADSESYEPRVWHAFCRICFPDPKPGITRAYCGHIQTIPATFPLGSAPAEDRCVVCVDLIAVHGGCPRCNPK